ncbi:MAG: metal ABC transporter ATP-binding protein [Coriobacteriia bacterium]|nr:metal ABC transporter ATP-binding protein [Coriobacteriia bacterium]
MNALLTLESASFTYGDKTAVEGLDFSLMPQDYLCVVGDNGSGKSTLLSGILRLKQPHTGRLSYNETLHRNQIGYLPQQHHVQGNFPASVLEVVLSGRLGHKGPAPFYTKHDRALAREALTLVGAGDLEQEWFGGLSGGQSQRVLIARALATAPDGLKLLILDEPMNGLDPHARTLLYELIRFLNTERGITVIMVTHDVNTAMHFCNRILLLATRQVFFGAPDEFESTELGREFIRDACGGNCAICGFSHKHDEGPHV